MRRSPFFPITVLLLVIVGGCAASKPAKLPALPVTVTRGSLAIAAGITAVSVALPAGFTADLAYAPIWLRQGAEIGVAGQADGKSVMLGLSVPGFANRRILAEDFGVAAPRGKLLDVAPSPDGLALATVVAEPAQGQVEVILRDTLGEGNEYTVAAIEGAFGAAQLTWVDAFTLLLALRSDPSPGASVPGTESDRSGFYAITAAGPPGIRQLQQIRCSPQQLSLSPSGRMAVTQGGDAQPALINLDKETCHTLGVYDPFQVLAWAPDSSAFLYSTSAEYSVPGIFRYDISSGRSVVVAISSSAAAYAGDGTIVALGNSWLAWRRAAELPDKPLNLQVALWLRGQQEITINTIGIATTARLLGRSRIVFSQASGGGVIDVVARGGEGLRRELIEYSYPARAAFPLATCAMDAPLSIGWSPDGKSIVVVDGGVQPNLLTVIAPPR